MKTTLFFAGACPEPGSAAAWAFSLRRKDGVAVHFLHAGSGVACRGSPASAELGSLFGLGYGLRWLADQGRAGNGKLALRGDRPAVLALVRPDGQPPPELARLVGRVRELLGAWPEWDAQVVGTDENGADELARGAWESATGKPYPARPTRRRRLPGLSREPAG